MSSGLPIAIGGKFYEGRWPAHARRNSKHKRVKKMKRWAKDSIRNWITDDPLYSNFNSRKYSQLKRANPGRFDGRNRYDTPITEAGWKQYAYDQQKRNPDLMMHSFQTPEQMEHMHRTKMMPTSWKPRLPEPSRQLEWKSFVRDNSQVLGKRAQLERLTGGFSRFLNRGIRRKEKTVRRSKYKRMARRMKRKRPLRKSLRYHKGLYPALREQRHKEAKVAKVAKWYKKTNVYGNL